MKLLLVLIAVVLILLLVLVFVLANQIDKDTEWLRADGDFDRARRAVGGNTPQDRLRTARIYLRTLQNDDRQPNDRDMQAARIIAGNELFAALDAEPPLVIIREIEDELGELQNILLAGFTRTTKNNAIQRAATDVATGEITRNEYLEAAQEWVTDGENVHDNSLNSDLRKTLRRAKELSTPMSVYDAFESARDAIFESDLAENRKAAALNTLKVIADGDHNVTFGDSEPEIFATVWSRAVVAGPNAKEAVLIGLAEGQRESGGTVCSVGRMARIIDSLNMTDPAMGGSPALTVKAYRDQVFAEIQEDLKEKIDAAYAAGNTAVADAYSGKSADYDETSPEYQEFRKNLEASIDDIVDSYAKHLNPTALESLRKDCKVIL